MHDLLFVSGHKRLPCQPEAADERIPDPRLPIIPLEFSGRSRYLAAQLAGNLLRTIADNLPAQLADNLLRTVAGILSAQ